MAEIGGGSKEIHGVVAVRHSERQSVVVDRRCRKERGRSPATVDGLG